LKNKGEIEQERGESEGIKGHPFMTSTKNHYPRPSVYMGRISSTPCGRPHAVDMKYTPLT